MPSNHKVRSRISVTTEVGREHVICIDLASEMYNTKRQVHRQQPASTTHPNTCVVLGSSMSLYGPVRDAIKLKRTGKAVIFGKLFLSVNL